MKIIKPSLIVSLALFAVSVTAGKVENSSCDGHARRFKWTSEEDALLLKLITENTSEYSKWIKIAELFNVKNNDKLRNRSARACRERYTTYLSCEVDRVFSKEDDEALFKHVKTHGKKWTFITKFFKNKTSTILKCRYEFLCRYCRYLNDAAKKLPISSIDSEQQNFPNFIFDCDKTGNSELDESGKSIGFETDFQPVEFDPYYLELEHDCGIEFDWETYFKNECSYFGN